MQKSISLLLVSICLFFINLNAQDFWKSTNGPYGGTVSGLAIDSNGYVYAGGDGGIYYSTNNGDSWLPLNKGLNGVSVYAITFDNNGNLLIGTNLGLYRSTDRGSSWGLISNSIGKISVSAIAVNKSGHIYLGSSNYGLYRSTNNGNSWANFSGGLSDQRISSIKISNNGNIFVGTHSGLNRSTNNGMNWQQVNDSLKGDIVYDIAIDSSGRIFTASQLKGLYRSTDNGLSWSPINNGLQLPSAQSIAISPNGNIFAWGFPGIFVSNNNGDSWNLLNTGIYILYTTLKLAINSSCNIFAGTYIGGMYRSTNNGNTWNQINNGLILSSVNTFVVNHQGQIFASIPNNGIYLSNDNGNNWNYISNLSNNYFSSMAIDSNGNLFIGSNGIYRSSDNGGTWTQMNNIISSSNAFVNTIVIDSLGYIYAGASDGSLWFSKNDGFDWSRIDNGFINETLTSLEVRSNGEIFAGVFGRANIYFSPDRGNNWNKLNVEPFFQYTHGLLVKPNNLVFATTDAGVLLSTDDGKSWNTINNGLSDPSGVRAIVQNSVGYLFVSSSDGVYQSTNNGDSWKQINNGLNKTSWPSLGFDSDGYLLAGTSGNGMYRSVNSTIPPIPSTPTAAFPLNGTLDAPLTYNLSWNPLDYAESYIIQVSIDTSFTHLVVYDSTITGLTKQITGLNDGIRYYWKVAAKNVIGTGPFSPVRYFSTIINTPGTLTAKALPSEKINLTWVDKSNNNLGYIIERKISTDNNYSIIDTVKSDTVGFTDTTLISINTFNYRIKAYNQIETSDYSNEASIKTLPQMPAAPSLISPANNLSHQVVTLNLSWDSSANADSYRLQVAGDSLFNNLFVNDSSITSAGRQVTGLNDGVKIYWRVSSKNAAGTSSFSEIRSFSTMLNTPENLSATAVPDLKVSLKWSDKSANESGYIIERKPQKDSLFTQIAEIKFNTENYIDSTPKSVNTYDYRIQAVNNIEKSLYSNIVTVSTITSIDERLSNLPTKFDLFQNYPNPFNPNTTIQYDVPKQSYVRICVYNLLGEIVSTLVNTVQDAGGYKVDWNSSRCASGFYFYSLYAKPLDGTKEYRGVKKMVLLK